MYKCAKICLGPLTKLNLNLNSREEEEAIYSQLGGKKPKKDREDDKNGGKGRIWDSFSFEFTLFLM